MTTSGSDRPDRERRRTLAVVAASAVAVLVVGVVAGVVVAHVALRGGEPGPLDAEAPPLAHFTFHSTQGCRFDADRGGLVAHLDLTTRSTGRFTVDLEAVPAAGVGDLDVTTPHAVRLTVPFYGGRAHKQFDVVVPLTRAEYDQGYRKCRYTLNPNGAD